MSLDSTAWRARAEAIAAALLARAGERAGMLDIQGVFRLLPPDSPAGESLFRLAEALPRTPDRGGRMALLADRVPLLRGRVRAALALPVAELSLAAVAGRFVFAEDIGSALAKSATDASPRNRYSFDMLGEGARTAADAARNQSRYLAAIEAAGAALAQGNAQFAERFGVSVKLTSIHPRVDAAGFSQARAALLERLGILCRAALNARIGLTLDAEESERAPLQFSLFEALAGDPSFLQMHDLGIAIQAYRTHATEAVEELLALARRRAERGGTRLAVRLVKGAYWDAEVKRAQELSLAAYPVHTDKADTDRSYIACAARLFGATEFVHPQFATHNPITMACLLAMAGEALLGDGRPPRFEFQRLHGMGEAGDRALEDLYPALPVRTYAPVGERGELLAYLVRRLLENGASTSFLRQAAQSEDGEALLTAGFAFLDESGSAHELPRPLELHMPARRSARGFDLGEPRVLAACAQAVEAITRHWRAAPLLDGKPQPGTKRQVSSPAHPDVVIGEVVDADAAVAGAAVSRAHAARTDWAETAVESRAGILDRVADLLEEHRVELMALCVWEAGKTLADALADVQEAVDFCRYYANQARDEFAPQPLPGPTGETNEIALHPRGVIACISPWNFPVAIFTGQVAAALVAGNTVVAKPAEQTPLAAFRIVQLMLAAGVPRGALQLVPGPGEVVGRAIVEDPRIAGVAFTGSNETANSIARALAARTGPIVPFIAETGGMNAMIVDSTALPEQVVDAVMASAFRSAGQRCSSLRVLYLQHEIAPRVLELLRGALAELRVGDPADAASDVGPLIDEDARKSLAAYVAELHGRARLVAEAPAGPASGSYLPPVAFEVGSMRDVPGERFGPILHVVRFAIGELDSVVDEINATGYGLTMGLHTRVEARIDQVRRRATVGNLYVNRNMIGAVVGVQPFGGEGLSGTGPKAGGPRYLARFATERVVTVNTAAAGGDLRLLTSAA
jgi:RHH-type proline utilization regulon transcriptional repressor/proline dehydrogenase/delta 1-pyrroline-5-carboxylate dehydrogenase